MNEDGRARKLDDPLAESRALAAALRYQGEAAAGKLTETAAPSHTAARAAFDGLEVTQDLMPGIADAVANAAQRLFAPANHVRAYIHPSAGIQASCTTLNDKTCYVRISSALAEAFDDAELEFVIGHEVGHHLLDHSRMDLDGEGELARFAIMRAREISCDRLGLIACGAVEPAMRAIMKTVSGLTSKRLRFDAAAYLRAAFADTATSERQHICATHPPMPVRARALLSFDQTYRSHYPDYNSPPALESFWRMDERVMKDMQRFSEQKAVYITAELEAAVREWIWLGAAVADGRLAAGERDELKRHVSDDFLEKTRRALAAMNVAEAHTFVTDKAVEAATKLHEVNSAHAQRYLETTLKASEAAFLNGESRNIVRTRLLDC